MQLQGDMHNRRKDFSRILKVLRTLWVIAGLAFLLWLVISYQSRGFPATVLQSDEAVTVEQTRAYLSFLPTAQSHVTGLLFYPGGMVDPKAYAPLARQLAENGFAVYVVKLPLGAAPLPGQEAQVMDSTRQLMATNTTIQHWVLSGHSRGGAIAARFVAAAPDLFAALILIGTSHPKEAAFDLSGAGLPVLKIYATQDGLASVAEIEETSRFLPKETTWARIEGGNHSQFGYGGTLLGDQRATISLADQQAQTVAAILSLLTAVDQQRTARS